MVTTEVLSSFTTFEQYVHEQFPAYAETAILDDLRKTDYSRLDEQDQVYLDYTGGNLYGISQIEKHHKLLKDNVLGNPHSLNPSSLKASELVEEARNAILDYFHSADDYFLVFTPNASGALKIIGESYPFDPNSHFLLPFDNHNSVNGIREYCKAKGAKHTYCPLEYDTLRFEAATLERNLVSLKSDHNNLFAYPAQSNVSGIKHDLNWIRVAKDLGWDVLLDASAYVPTDKLDLRAVKPDFVSVSFYKMFGYPTGLGGLFIRKNAFKKLQKPWFAGGTVTLASAMTDQYYLAEDHAKFEDGTINYLDIPALKIGIDHIRSAGIETIRTRVCTLADIMIEQLQVLTHSNGKPLVKIFGPLNCTDRGGTIIFNFLNREGAVYPYMNVEREANKQRISLRTGCFCNPGIDEINNHLAAGDLEKYFKSMRNASVEDMMEQLHTMRGAVRISAGLVTNLKDIYRLLLFVKDFKG
jgi:selenocysteine lyase/cysteine desulfurase